MKGSTSEAALRQMFFPFNQISVLPLALMVANILNMIIGTKHAVTDCHGQNYSLLICNLQNEH